MKGVYSLIALLLVFVAFTMWSMYEDSRKRIIEEDFSTGLLGWIIDSSSDSLKADVQGDTLVLFGGQETAIRYEKPLSKNFAVNLSMRLVDPTETSLLVFFFNAQGEKNIGQPDSILMLSINKNKLELVYAGQILFVQEDFHPEYWNKIELKHRNDTLRFLTDGDQLFQGVVPIANKGRYFGINLRQGVLELTQLKFTSLRETKP